MNAVVYKHPLSLEGHDIKEVSMPLRANVLTVQVQNGVVCLWALVPTDVSPFERQTVEETRRFLVIGTGHRMPERPNRYLGTVQMMGGSLVLHVFELGAARG